MASGTGAPTRERGAQRTRPGDVRAARVPRRWWLVATALLLVAVVVGLHVGAVRIAPADVLAELLGRLTGHGSTALDPTQQAVLWELRAPRVVLGAVVGLALALSGAAYQGTFDNPLADPYLLGVAGGAGLGATLAVALRAGATAPVTLPLWAFAGAVLAVAATYLVGRSVGGRSTVSLVLAGVAVAAFCQAVQTFVQQAHTDDLRAIYSFLLGSLGGAGWEQVRLAGPYVLVAAVVMLAHRRLLDALRLGDVEARALGVRTGRVRLVVVAAATLATAAAVSVSGLVGFVGIVVPHAVRLLVGSANAVVLPLSAAFGAAFLVLADVAARSVAAPAEVPIGVVTAAVGAPFFAVVLRTRRRELR